MNIKIKGLIVSLLMAICVFVADAGGVKYVFYFIGDGMGMGHVNAAQYYNRMVKGDGDRLFMQQFPYAGICTTYSASHRVTDSAAAGTALATGYKTNNGMLGLSPDTLTSYNSIASVLKSEGWGVGVLSSLSLMMRPQPRSMPIGLSVACDMRFLVMRPSRASISSEGQILRA